MNAGLQRATLSDQRGWLWVTTLLSLIYSVLALLVRGLGKYGQLWIDDAVLALAYGLAFARWALQMQAISRRLGTALDVQNAEASTRDIARASDRKRCTPNTELNRPLQSSFVVRILLIACLYLAKISVLVFSRKIFSGNLNHEKILFAIAYAVVVVGGIASILAASIGCRPENYILSEEHLVCPTTLARSLVICASDALSEMAIVVLPIILLAKLQMARSKKMAVCSVYLVRFSILGFSFGQAASYQHFLNRHGQTSVGLVPTLVLQELWLTYSFLSATVPCMRPLLGAFNSGALLMTAPGNSSTHQSKYALGSSFALTSLKRPFRSKEVGSIHQPADSNLRPDDAFYGVDIRHEERQRSGEGESLASDASERMIIRRDTQINVLAGNT